MAHHHHHHCCHGGDHSHGEEDPAVLYSLYKRIDLLNVQCYNESEEGAGRGVFKPWEERLNQKVWWRSECEVDIMNTVNSGC